MASWRDNLRPASYRGVPFEVLSDELAGGRRSVITEYPYRDEADSEDLGKKARTYRVTAVIAPGADFMARRDALIKAIEDGASPGFLIHPYYGQQFVRPGPFSVTHTSTEGGWCRLSLEFTVVAAEAKQPAQSADTGHAVAVAATALHAQAKADLATGVSIVGQPSHVAAAATAMIGKAQAAISDAAAKLTGYGDPLNSFVREAQAIRGNLLGLATAPTTLASRLSGLLQGLGEVASTPQALLGVLHPLMSFGSNLLSVAHTTPARAREADNQDAVIRFVRHAAAAEAVLAVANTDFASYEEAVAARDALGDVMDDLALAAGDAHQDDAMAAIESARQAMVQDVTARGGSLAHLRNVTPAGTIPVLLLAYRLFDDLDALEANAVDLVARNRIVHPGFVPGGRALEVLSDG